jgi:hypothetical protein
MFSETKRKPSINDVHPFNFLTGVDVFTVLAEDVLHLESYLRWNDERLMESAEVQQVMSLLV